MVKNYEPGIGWWRTSIGKRVFSLLIPYVFWCTVGGICRALVRGVNSYASFRGILDCYGITQICPSYFNMWYVRNLFLLCLLSPALIWIVKKGIKCAFVRLVIILSFVCCSFMQFPMKIHVVMPVFCFAFGIWCAWCPRLLDVRLRWQPLSLFAGALLLSQLVAFFAGPNWVVGALRWPLRFVAILWVWSGYDRLMDFEGFNNFVQSDTARWFYGSSFFLYCFHMAFVLYVPSWPRCISGSILQPFVQTAVLVLASAVLSWLLRTYAPKLNSVVAGGR